MDELEDLSTAIRGVGVTPATPFTNDLEDVDWEGLESNLEFLVNEGVGLLYIAGNTGEVMSLSPEEWTGVVEVALDVAGDSVAVVPGIGHEYPMALELARRARRLGVDGLLLMPRTQPYASSPGLAEYWKAILDTAELPGVLYKKGLPDVADLLDLVSLESVVACKYAEKDISEFTRIVADCTSNVIWTCGIAERYAPFYSQAGAEGFTSGLANFSPSVSMEMHSALRNRDLGEALEIRQRLLPFEEIRARNGDIFNVAAVKKAMDLSGLAGGGVRPPLIDLDTRSAADVEKVLPSLTGVDA